MRFAAILGSFLLLYPVMGLFPAVSAAARWQSSQPQAPENLPAGRATPDQPAAPLPPCSTGSHPDTMVKPDCEPVPAASKGRKRRGKKNPPKVAVGTTPTKTVVQNGGTTDPTGALSPGLSQQQASQQLQKTNEKLSQTDANLKQISNRQLSAAQQDTVNQIKTYMEQAKTAASSGDVQRAYNLANKAHLLAEELVGH